MIPHNFTIMKQVNSFSFIIIIPPRPRDVYITVKSNEDTLEAVVLDCKLDEQPASVTIAQNYNIKEDLETIISDACEQARGNYCYIFTQK